MFTDIDHDQLSLLDLKQDFCQYLNCDVSRTAIHKRFNLNSVAFLKELLLHHLSITLHNQPIEGKFLESFNSITVKDSTKFTLPKNLAGEYPGYGGFNSSSGLMNIQYEYELITGQWICLELTKATRNDQQDSKESIDRVMPGDLLIRDLGYATLSYMRQVNEKDAYFLNRLPSKTAVFIKGTKGYKKINWDWVDKLLEQSNKGYIELQAFLGIEEKMPVRMIIDKIPETIYEQRIRKATKSAKSKKCQLSDEYKVKARYNIFVTNAPEDKLPSESVLDLYRLRWQIEIVFKTWKSVAAVHKVKKMKKERFESQLLAKMLWVLLNWKFLLIGNACVQRHQPDKGCSHFKFFKLMKRYTHEIRQIIFHGADLCQWINKRFFKLIADSIIEVKKGKKSLYQRLYKVKICLS